MRVGPFRRLLARLVLVGTIMSTIRTARTAEPQSAADALPRKVVVATIMKPFGGDLSERLKLAVALIDSAAQEAKRAGLRGLDLVVLPEGAISTGHGWSANDLAVDLATVESFGATARQHRTYVVLPVILREGDRVSNTAVVFDRAGKVAGIYRKVHPVAEPNGSLENGVTPGAEFPVFTCDFGKLGIQICWDMSYEDGWLALARAGAEIVAMPSASPQTIRPAMYALRGRYYVVSSTPRNNATIFNPIGLPVAQITQGEVLVQSIDLAYAVLHWSLGLEDGRALKRRFGDRVAYVYSEREDTGVFWSNDPQMSIGQMIRELNLQEMPAVIDRSRRVQDAARQIKQP